MTHPTAHIDAEYVDDSAKIYLLNDYIRNKTNRDMYGSPENSEPMNAFFDQHKNMYHTLYRRSDKIFHMTLYILLSIHFSIDKEKIEEALLNGDILKFAYEAIEDTDHVKELMSNAKSIHVTVNPNTDEAYINPIH
jgi:hypothetical protein